MSSIIANKQFDQERALYNVEHATISHCIFAGPEDGESVLKEARDIDIKGSQFSLRYPLWHVQSFKISDSEMDELSRAAIWYATNGMITDSVLNGVKAVRECENIKLIGCRVNSEEFGWKSKHIILEDTQISSEYLLFESEDVKLKRVKMTGKYSFQYIKNLEIQESELKTKDAFWHSKNITVRDSVIQGEYLGWFSDGLTLINCRIIGTQPLCYCKNLKLINCTMEETDLAFEYSDVDADIKGHVDSIKNPRSGIIKVDSVGEVIRDNPVMTCTGSVVTRNAETWIEDTRKM